MAILNKLQKGQAITSDILNNIIEGIRECQLQSVVGGYFRRGTGGTTITIAPTKAGAGGQICPFTPTANPVCGGFTVSFSIGTINGILPTNIFSVVTGVTTAQNNYFYIKCDTDGKVITEAVIENDTTLRTPVQPTADTAPEEFNILIGYMTTAGLTERIITCGNLSAKIAPSIQEDSETYVAGQRNYTQYYNWIYF